MIHSYLKAFFPLRTARFVVILISIAIGFANKTYSQNPVINAFSMVRDSAFGSTWDTYDTTLVAYNVMQPNGYFGIYFAHVTASNQLINETCFTCGNASLPGKNVGVPVFQAGGKYVAMVAEKANHPGSSKNSVPGIGTFSDVWFMTRDGQKTYQMTNTADTGNASGILFPFFSPDGRKFSWTEMTGPVNLLNGKQEFGYWVVKTADIYDDGINPPSFANIKVLQPGGVPAFNEAYGWSPDGSKIIFASCYNQFWVLDDQVYEMDTDGTNIHQLTQCCDYNEHAFYSPDGKYIVWMTNTGTNTGSTKGGDDWWIMHSDSTDRQRLTYFNDTTSAFWTGNTHILGHGCFSPGGTRIIGDVGGNKPIQLDTTQIGAVYIFNIGSNSANGLTPIEGTALMFKIYPNPFSTETSLQSDEVLKNATLTIYNVYGQEVRELQNLSGQAVRLKRDNLASGLYFVRLSQNNRVIETGKLMVSN